MKIVSACLVEINCRWNGGNELNKKIKELVYKGEAIAVCPEVLGGLAVPRESAGIYGGLGNDVLSHKATIRTINDGKDITSEIIKGCKEVLRIAKFKGIRVAILRNESPSCGCGKTWQLDDNFVNHLVDGDGVLTALLKKNGIKVYTEEDFVIK